MGHRYVGGNLAANVPAHAAQQRFSAQQQLMYQQHKNQVQDSQRPDVNQKIMENQARAAQLSEAINRQKQSI